MTLARHAADLLLDARYALRAVRKDLRLFAFAVLIVGLGVGACTAVYSILDPLLLGDLPFEDPERLVWVANDAGGGGMSGVTSRTSNLRDFRALTTSFDGLTGYFAFFEAGGYNLIGEGEPVKLIGADVAHDFLDVLGIRPLHGRTFSAEEGRWGGPSTVLLSHGLWTRQFGADPAVVGRPITINDTSSVVVGVLPSTFDFASTFAPHTRVDFLRPFPISDETDRWGNTLSIIGRLAPGVTSQQAQADLDRVIQGLEADDPERWGLVAVVTGMQAQIAGPFRAALLLLAAAAAAVMLIVCVNLSNLLLVKGARRHNEMAVRSALGAPRSRLIRQMLLESLILSAGGAVVGLIVAVAATRFVAGTRGLDIPLLRTVSVDAGALWFSAGLAAVIGILVGMLPAMRIAAGREGASFRGSRRGMTSNRRGIQIREGLVVAEVAMASVLLVAGGLMLRSFQNVLDVDLGFTTEEVVSWQINTTRSFDTLTEQSAFFDQLVANVEAVPGVTSVGLTDALPLGRNRTWPIAAPGFDYPDGDVLGAFPHLVSRGYLDTMKIPLIAGRAFTSSDTEDRGGVVILNETAARGVFQGESALGRAVDIAGSSFQVVGIVADTRHRSLEMGAGLQMYLPITQVGDFQTLDMVVRSTMPTASLAGSVGAAIHDTDATLPTAEFQALTAVVERSVSPRRFTLQILIAFAGVALLLAALGIYAVLSFSVTERLHEIGIRMALGETGGQIMRRLVGKTLALTALGLALGAVASIAVSRWIGSLLFGIEPFDPSTFVAMATLLISVAFLAGFIPALRASRTPAVSVLRGN